MVWLTGLSPNVMVYDVKVMAIYLVLTGVVLTIFSALAFANPLYSLSSVILLVPAWLLVQKGKARWDAEDPAGF
jgi:hypothetical protein